MILAYFQMKISEDCALTRATWQLFSRNERASFLNEISTPILLDASNNMNFIPEKGSVCMVCVVNAITEVPSSASATHKLVSIFNGLIGKTWGKLSQKKKHSDRAGHESLYFCSTKRNIAMVLQFWKLGLQNIDGIEY